MNNDDINWSRLNHLEKTIDKRMAESDKRYQERIRAVERDILRLQELVDAKMAAQAMALEKSEDAYNARFANANEFRASLEDFANRSVSRDYVDTRFNSLIERVGLLESRISNIDGRIIGYSAGIGAVVLIIAVIIELMGLRL